MKKVLFFWTVLLVCILAGCGAGQEETLPLKETSAPTTEIQAVPDTELPTAPTAEPTTEPEVDVESALWAVIDGICSIVTEDGATDTLSGYLYNQYGAYPASCALVDFDGDGQNEMVISTTSQDASYVVLHYSEGDIFAFDFEFRELECLKTDGSFIATSSAYCTDYCRLRFNGGRCITVREARSDQENDIYQINNEPSSKQEVEDFSKRWYSKADVYWTWLDMVPEEPPVTEAPDTFEPYLQQVSNANQSIYSGPGYDYGFVMSIGTAGTYTIVEEAWDREGNLWGKLKSGAGWIDLTEVRSQNQTPDLITANFADRQVLSGEYHHYVGDTSEYAVQIAFRASQQLHWVTFYAVGENSDGSPWLVDLYFLEDLTPDQPLVVEVSFPGDMTTYAIGFTDSQGQMHYYAITISGRNGALEMYPLAL